MALTAKVMREVRARCQEVGMTTYPSKPVKRDQPAQVLRGLHRP